jgi:hypothetical protein
MDLYLIVMVIALLSYIFGLTTEYLLVTRHYKNALSSAQAYILCLETYNEKLKQLADAQGAALSPESI